MLPLANKNVANRDLGRRERRHFETDDVPELDAHFQDINVEAEDDDLQQILSKARRLKQKEAFISKNLQSTNITAAVVKPEQTSDDEENDIKDANITLNATAEFCRTLGDIPTYGMSGNRDELAGDMMDYEIEALENDEPMVEERSTGVWNSVNPNLEIIAEEKPNEVVEVAILDEEPDVGSGMGAALKLALSKGYLEKEETNRPSNTRMAHLQAKNYSIEDKAYV